MIPASEYAQLAQLRRLVAALRVHVMSCEEEGQIPAATLIHDGSERSGLLAIIDQAQSIMPGLGKNFRRHPFGAESWFLLDRALAVLDVMDGLFSHLMSRRAAA